VTTRTLAPLLLAALAAQAAAHPDHSDSWEEFKQSYGKQYDSAEEESYRRTVWADRVDLISSHNTEADTGAHSYRLGENELADMTTDEIVSLMTGTVVDTAQVAASPDTQQVPDTRLGNLPLAVDWRDKGYVTHVKNQKHCGSCWAFSAVGSMEGAHFKATGKLVSLSEQNLVDCSEKEGNKGCMGGLMDRAFEYVIKNQGIDTESSYEYTAKTGKTCNYTAAHKGATISSYKDIPHNNEKALQEAVATIGPISVAIDASKPTFHFYKSGVYHDKTCSSVHLDHGVLAVGYGIEDSKDYWIVKNSWGVTWGEKGYIKMARDMDNACGIATQASYPIV